ncbi:hypothetical protein AFLA_001104 [Aspergillus flavus NRRL3357]|nr:hypothetical protein AFLA_001104 [Aspergillus flavus NRRL3357]
MSTWDPDDSLPLMPNSSGHQSRLRRLSFCGQRHGNHPEPKVRRQDPPSKSTLIIFNQFHHPALAALVRRRPATLGLEARLFPFVPPPDISISDSLKRDCCMVAGLEES